MTPYYDKDGIIIYCGDCLEIMPKLSLLLDGIIADLPYGTTECKWDSVIPFEPLWENYKRLIKPIGAIVLFSSQPFTSALVMSNPSWFKYEWVWRKNRPSDKFNAKNRPMKAHESICIFSNGTTANGSNNMMQYYPQDLIDCNKKVRGRTGKRHYGDRPLTSRKETYILEQTNYPISILEFDKDDIDTKHATQKPIALMSYLIRTYTNPSEIILDNTMGTGTTLVAAQNEGRKAIGIELSEEYCKIAVDRLRQPSFFSLPQMQVKVDKPEQGKLF